MAVHHASGSSMGDSERDWEGVPKDVRNLMKSQRRVRGVITSVSDGRCLIQSEYGVFPCDKRSVKANKNHPHRDPQKGDPCEFRLTQQRPIFAVSIRISVPKAMDPEAMKQCYTMLEQTCGGIAPLVYQIEGATVRHAVCILYLALRIVDTLSEHSLEEVDSVLQVLRGGDDTDGVVQHLLSYSYTLPDSLEKSMLQALPHVVSLLRALPPQYSKAVCDGVALRCDALAAQQKTARISHGGNAENIAEYTSLCNCLGGTLSEALCLVFSVQQQDEGTQLDREQAKSAGIFVLKCHSVRMQWLGGLTSGARWPSDTWHGGADAGTASADGVEALRSMIVDALGHGAKAMGYLASLAGLKAGLHPFRFTAVQVALALTQLSMLWGSVGVLSRGASIGREACYRLMSIKTPQELAGHVQAALAALCMSIQAGEPLAPEALEKMAKIEASLAPLLTVGTL